MNYGDPAKSTSNNEALDTHSLLSIWSPHIQFCPAKRQTVVDIGAIIYLIISANNSSTSATLTTPIEVCILDALKWLTVDHDVSYFLRRNRT